MSPTRSTLLAGALALGGCTSPYDGTWMFIIDPEPSDYSGDCKDDADTKVEDNSGTLVDIYSTPANGIVVLFGQALYGEYDGSGFDAEYEETYRYSNSGYTYASKEGMIMSVDRSGSTLEGTVTDWQEVNDDGDVYQCAIDFDFTAERIASTSGRYPED